MFIPKKLLRISAVTLAIMSLTNCSSNKEEKGYIARSDIKIENGHMSPEVLLSLGRLSDPQLSPNGKTILYTVRYISIEENRTNNTLYACDADGANPRELTKFGKSISNVRWSADGKSVYYLLGGQIHKALFKGNKLGRAVIISDFPAGIGEFKLSPDGKKVLFTSTIKNSRLQEAADIDPKLDKAQAYSTEDLMYRHWDHWVTEIPRSYVCSLEKGLITPEKSMDILGEEPFELPTEPLSGIEQLSWHPDSRHIAYSCRKKSGIEYAFSTNTEIFIYDASNACTTQITKGGGYDTDPVWSPDGTRLAWISMARDGYEADRQRLMCSKITFSGNGEAVFSEPEFLSASLDRDVAGIFWTPDSKNIIFSSLTDGLQALFRVKAEGEAKVERITPAEWWYDFNTPFALINDGKTLLTSYESLDFPNELVAITLKDGKASELTRVSHENDHIFSRLAKVTSKNVTVRTVDGKDMFCWVMYPPEFDESKQYPAIEIVLGGPQGTLSQSWSYRWCYRLMAQQGYIVMMPNRRGTTAFGQEWKEQISGDYCGLNMQDYLAAGRYIKSLPYVSKLACAGASYGGYSAYMLEGMHGDLYDCFIAHAGIFDPRQLYFTTEELWFANWDNGGLRTYSYTPGQQGPAGDGITFGGMQQAGAPYSKNPKAVRHYSNMPSDMVTKWHTPILCIHGMKDYRIPYEQGMAAFNAAKMQGVPAKLLIFPEENHWILQPQNALLWHREFFAWLERWLKN